MNTNCEPCAFPVFDFRFEKIVIFDKYLLES